jgi:nucleotide-binding universal stress UspA family protein
MSGTTSVQQEMFPLKKILVATDGSENAKRAVEAAIKISKQFDSELIILNVIAAVVPLVYPGKGSSIPATDCYSRYFEEAEKTGKKLVNEAVDGAKNEKVKARGSQLRTISSVPEAILDNAFKENVNLIVVGTRGLGGFEKLLLGSVASAVVAHAHCAVLVVR